MSVKIRLRRVGAKGRPLYKIVVIDSRKRREGRPIETVGSYDPHNNDNTSLKSDIIDAWIKKGAIPTPTVKGLIKKAGNSSL